jgi:hypothetical protein
MILKEDKMAESSTQEESTRTYHLRVFYRNVEDTRRITVTAYCSDDSGNPVNESNLAFTHYEATWIEAGRSPVHLRTALDYRRCMSFQDAYDVALHLIQVYLWETLGQEYSVRK